MQIIHIQTLLSPLLPVQRPADAGLPQPAADRRQSVLVEVEPAPDRVLFQEIEHRRGAAAAAGQIEQGQEGIGQRFLGAKLLSARDQGMYLCPGALSKTAWMAGP